MAANEEEAARIEELANAAGMTPSAYLREAATRRTISWRVNAGARRELRRIGVNLNQLAKLANTSSGLLEEQQLRECLHELQRVLSEL